MFFGTWLLILPKVKLCRSKNFVNQPSDAVNESGFASSSETIFWNISIAFNLIMLLETWSFLTRQLRTKSITAFSTVSFWTFLPDPGKRYVLSCLVSTEWSLFSILFHSWTFFLWILNFWAVATTECSFAYLTTSSLNFIVYFLCFTARPGLGILTVNHNSSHQIITTTLNARNHSNFHAHWQCIVFILSSNPKAGFSERLDKEGIIKRAGIQQRIQQMHFNWLSNNSIVLSLSPAISEWQEPTQNTFQHFFELGTASQWIKQSRSCWNLSQETVQCYHCVSAISKDPAGVLIGWELNMWCSLSTSIKPSPAIFNKQESRKQWESQCKTDMVSCQQWSWISSFRILSNGWSELCGSCCSARCKFWAFRQMFCCENCLWAERYFWNPFPRVFHSRGLD